MDPHLDRISRRLTALELRQPDPGDDALVTEVKPGSPFGRVTRRFVQTYSAAGLKTVIRETGLEEKLQEQGLGDYRIRITDDDPFRHRLEILLPDDVPGLHGGRAPEDRHIMDMHLHLTSVALPGVEEQVDVVVVEWLLMQNPRRVFTKDRPRLPGQRHPGTGLGRIIAQLLWLMCRRIGRDGLINIPERFHLDELYARAGWIAVDPEHERFTQGVLAASEGLSLAARAWAMERGFVTDENGQVARYTPHERVMPVSERLEKALKPGGFLWLQRLLDEPPRFTVDVDALRRSLRAFPVEGMDPDHLEG